MAVSLTTHGGKPALEIADHKGECFLYLFQLCGDAGGWAVRLTKIDPQSGPGRMWTVRAGVPWRCDCPDYTYRKKRTTGEPCKHTEAARQLKELLAALTGVPS